MSETLKKMVMRRPPSVERIMDVLHDGLRNRLDLLIDDNLRFQRKAELGWEFLRAAQKLHEAAELPEMLEPATASIKELTGVRGAAVSIIPAFSDNATSLYCQHGLTLGEADDLIFAVKSPLLTAVRESAGLFRVADLVGKTGPRSKTRAVLRRLGIEMVAPLSGRDSLLGLVLLTARTDRLPLNADRLELLNAYTRVLSLGIENLLLRNSH
jgi:GAF domain-containing protein